MGKYPPRNLYGEYTVFIFENLRSIHISVGIPIFSTLSERHARLVFQIGYIGICSCGFYLTFLGYIPQIQIFGKNIYFWPNLDILYICLGFTSIIGIVQLMLKISKTKISPLKLSNNKIPRYHISMDQRRDIPEPISKTVGLTPELTCALAATKGSEKASNPVRCSAIPLAIL